MNRGFEVPLHLTLREAPQFAWECAGLRPDLLADGPALAVGQLPVLVGRETLPLGDLFNVRGQADDGEVIMEGDLSGCRRLGAGMASGTLRVRGPVGPFLGVEMKGGLIDVDGPAGDWAGAEMRGGILRIQGDAADHLGAALPGSRLGMRGGTVLVHGNAGSMVGLAMRRGLIAIAGTVVWGPQNRVGVAGARVEILDARPGVTKPRVAVTNCAGNFFLRKDEVQLAYPLVVRVVPPVGTTVTMQTPIYRERSCAGCHAAQAGPRSGVPSSSASSTPQRCFAGSSAIVQD